MFRLLQWRLLPVLIFFFFSYAAHADQLIIEPDMGRAPILNMIKETQHSLDLVMYGFTDKTLLDAIINKKNQGKTVNIILEKTPYKAESENTKTIQTLDQHHVNWQGNTKSFRLIHQKTLITDDNKAMIMTFNFTNSTFKNQRNFALIIDDPKRVKAITNIFAADWNNHPTGQQPSELILSPDNSREKLLTLIQQAKSSLQIYSQSVNDYKIIGALAKAARRGVTVELLTSAKIREKQANYMLHAGMKVHQSKKMYIHAKIFIIDKQKAVIGSINLTRASLDDNRELSVLTEDQNIVRQLGATFTKDWHAAEGLAGQPYLNERTIKHAVKIFKHLLKTFE